MDLKQLLTQSMGLRSDECAGLTAVVTGAAQGIGLETACAFAVLGGRVVIADIDEKGRQAAEEIFREGGQALFVRTDVSSADEVRRLAEATRAEFGRVDVLVNNAIRSPVVSVVDMDPADWDAVMAVNLRGTFLTCKTFLPEMIAWGSGTIINMVSTDAMPGLAAYIASKQGIVGLSQSLDLEVGPAGVKVIPFGPGMVDTPGIRSVSSALAPRLGMTQEQFLGVSLHAAYDGLMPPEHAGAAAVYLALRLADEFHGQMVNGYEVLERAGLLQSTIVERGEPTTDQPAAPTTRDRRVEALRLAGEVQQVLLTTEQDFGKLPAFVRPLARNGFKSKAGASLADWQRTLAGIEALLDAGEGPQLASRLEKLVLYFEGVPNETARFTRDQELLRQVAELSNQRIALIRALIAALQ